VRERTILCLAAVLLVALIPAVANSQAIPFAAPEAVAPQTATAIPGMVDVDEPAAEQPKVNADGEKCNAFGQRRLSIRERRALGLTWRNVFQTTRDLYQDGEIDSDMARGTIAAMVFTEIAGENPKAFADPSVDWDAILAFIEEILPLILQLIGLFS